jgi:capsid protein
MATNPLIDHSVKLSIDLIEADQVVSPVISSPAENEIDGVILDNYGNPVRYRVLKQHPGEQRSTLGFYDNDFKMVPASAMIHIYRADRPGQHRGIPEITPALEIFEMMRGF